MLAFPEMLVDAAISAGIKTPVGKDAVQYYVAMGAVACKPQSPDEFDVDRFPHFAVFCNVQLCRPLVRWGEHFENAKVIAKVSNERIRTIRLDDLMNMGLMYTSTISI